METQKERLLQFIKFLGISIRAFERSISTSSSTVSNMKKNVSPGLLKKIAKEYPMLNTFWLRTGEGNMLKPAPEGETLTINTGTAIQHSAGAVLKVENGDEVSMLRARVKELESKCEDLQNLLRDRELRIARLEGMVEILKG